jgi:hypothetical protein
MFAPPWPSLDVYLSLIYSHPYKAAVYLRPSIRALTRVVGEL